MEPAISYRHAPSQLPNISSSLSLARFCCPVPSIYSQPESSLVQPASAWTSFPLQWAPTPSRAHHLRPRQRQTSLPTATMTAPVFHLLHPPPHPRQGNARREKTALNPSPVEKSLALTNPRPKVVASLPATAPAMAPPATMWESGEEKGKGRATAQLPAPAHLPALRASALAFVDGAVSVLLESQARLPNHEPPFRQTLRYSKGVPATATAAKEGNVTRNSNNS